MAEKKDPKKTIWLYAVILFTSAFIVLLLTAYSQIKFSRNINDYKSQISNESSQKMNVQTNLNSALEEIKKLNEESKSLKEELSKVKQEQDRNLKAAADIQEKLSQTITSYDTLMQAEAEYQKGNYVQCAELLHRQFNIDTLGNMALEKYRTLASSSYKRAAEKLYLDGYNSYMNKNYEDAVRKLQLSLDLSPNEIYSSECYYFKAYSYYRMGNNNLARDAILQMQQAYPNSYLLKDANDLLKRLGD